MSSDIAIKVENLSKCYQIYDAPHERLKQFVIPRVQNILGFQTKNYFKEFWALKNVSFEVRRGETVGIIGRNGSGKSTLLQMICGTLSPTSGSITTNGRIAALLELGSGFNPEFTGRENVYLNASVLGLSKEKIDARFDEIERFADIGEFIGQPVKTYSSGMLVRLAFAVIAHVDADILVIDEALAVGDAFFTQKCMRYLRKFMETGTVLFVSHDAGSITALCNLALRLEQGAMLELGYPKIICENYLEDFYTSNYIQDNSVQNRQTIAKDSSVNLDGIEAPQPKINTFNHNKDSKSFGVGGVKIEQVELIDKEGQQQTLITSKTLVILRIVFKTIVTIENPIVGFYVKDRLGQNLFGDNTYLSCKDKQLKFFPNSLVEAQFHFEMPRLLFGDYSIAVAVADGTLENHVQQQWIHDALIFKSTGGLSTGIIGIPMSEIKLIKLE